jgi:hypothetical protein
MCNSKLSRKRLPHHQFFNILDFRRCSLSCVCPYLDNYPELLWIRKYFFQIRIRGSLILNIGSGSRRPINYGSIRILPGLLWPLDKRYCQIGLTLNHQILKNIEIFFCDFLESLITRIRKRIRNSELCIRILEAN